MHQLCSVPRVASRRYGDLRRDGAIGCSQDVRRGSISVVLAEQVIGNAIAVIARNTAYGYKPVSVPTGKFSGALSGHVDEIALARLRNIEACAAILVEYG